jgi:SAM-dependent methyltransferase
VHAEAPADGHVGFETRISPAQLPWKRVGLVRIEASARRGDHTARRLLAVVPVARSTGRSGGLPRFAYEQVWDRSSGNLTQARQSVASYDDEAEWSRSGASTAQHVSDLTCITPNDVVLEIGCGAGRVGTKLAPRCQRWIGADVSTNMLGFAREALAKSEHANVSFVHLNGVDLAGVPDVSVDVVYCTAVFMHLDEWERYRYIADAYRVLRPGGRIYFDNFCLGSPMGWQLFDEMARLDPAARPPNVSKSSTVEELQVYAEKAGYRNIRVTRGELFVTLVAEKPAPGNPR